LVHAQRSAVSIPTADHPSGSFLRTYMAPSLAERMKHKLVLSVITDPITGTIVTLNMPI